VRPRRSLPGADGHRSGKPSPARVPRDVLMDARLRRQGHSLTPHDVSPQPPLSSAATYRAEWGCRPPARAKERRKREVRRPPLALLAPSSSSLLVPRDDEVCMLYQGRRASPCVPDVLRTVLRLVEIRRKRSAIYYDPGETLPLAFHAAT